MKGTCSKFAQILNVLKKERIAIPTSHAIMWANLTPTILFALIFSILIVSCKGGSTSTPEPAAEVETKTQELGFAPGDIAPAFTLNNINNRSYSLGNFKGSLVILTFWNNSCATCLTGLDDLSKVYAKYKPRGLVVIAINTDTKANYSEVYNFVKNHKLYFPVLLDQELEVYNLYKVQNLPETFIIDPEGKFISIVDPVWAEDSIRITTNYPWNSKMYSQIIEDLLNKYFGNSQDTPTE